MTHAAPDDVLHASPLRGRLLTLENLVRPDANDPVAALGLVQYNDLAIVEGSLHHDEEQPILRQVACHVGDRRVQIFDGQ